MPAKRRKRGGQPGNQNARKHGNYSKVLTPRELEILKEVASLDEHGKLVVLGCLFADLFPELRREVENLRPGESFV